MIHTPRLARAPRPGLGLALAALGGLAFAALAVTVRRQGRAVRWDEAACRAVHVRAVRRSRRTLALAQFGGALGHEIAFLITLALGGLWLGQRRWRALAMLVVGVLGGNTWFVLLSRAFQRPRPVFLDPLHRVAGPGFPSGHSMTAVTLYGLLLHQLWPGLRSAPARALAVCSAGSVMLLVGLGRLYVGDHYPLDVLGGYSFGLGWAALSYSALDAINFRSR